MDKTISISIGGFSFIVDDGAYSKLKTYLDEIRRSLNGMEGIEEVITDVEIRIAELFRERLGVREVVNESDVDNVISIMGRPEQYVDEDAYEDSNTHKSYSSKSGEKKKKKLYRDPDDKVLGGVLSGLAHYLGIETWITRVLWIVLFFVDLPFTGASFTIVAYIILLIILPKAVTATQKYEMYGEAGDFESIKTNIKKTTHDVKSMAKGTSSTLGEILRVFAKIALIGIGLIFIGTGIGFLIGAVATLFSYSSGIPFKFFSYVVDYEWQEWTAKGLVMVLLLIPAILSILFGARLMSSRVKINKLSVFSSIALWFIAVIGASVLAVSLGSNFNRDIEFSEKKNYSLTSDTIKISFDEFKIKGNSTVNWRFKDDLDGFVEFDGKLQRMIEDDIEVRQSPNDQLMVEIIYSSRGSNADDARNNAESIDYKYAMNSKSELVFNNYLTLNGKPKYRNQSISITVYVPKGKVIYAENIDDLIFYNPSLNSKNYKDGTNKFYKFVEDNLECLNCTAQDSTDEKTTSIFESDSSKVKITKEGIRIQDGEDKIIINKKKIKISDGTDSINIDFSGN